MSVMTLSRLKIVSQLKRAESYRFIDGCSFTNHVTGAIFRWLIFDPHSERVGDGRVLRTRCVGAMTNIGEVSGDFDLNAELALKIQDEIMEFIGFDEDASGPLVNVMQAGLDEIDFKEVAAAVLLYEEKQAAQISGGRRRRKR